MNDELILMLLQERRFILDRLNNTIPDIALILKIASENNKAIRRYFDNRENETKNRILFDIKHSNILFETLYFRNILN